LPRLTFFRFVRLLAPAFFPAFLFDFLGMRGVYHRCRPIPTKSRVGTEQEIRRLHFLTRLVYHSRGRRGQMFPYLDWKWLLSYSVLWLWLLWAWSVWLRAPGTDLRSWRRYSIIAGLCFVTISTGMSTFLFVHAAATGGYPFYNPIELSCILWGTLTALLAIAAAIIGTGKPRLSIVVLSVVNLLAWFMDAMAQ